MQNLISLLNLEDSALLNNKITTEFLKTIRKETSETHLSFDSGKWFAIEKAQFKYKGNIYDINIILKIVQGENKGFYWAIDSVAGELFRNSSHQSSSTYFINPMNDEVGFTELNKALTNIIDIANYVSPGRSIDPLSEFIYLLKTKELKFINMKEVEYIFRDISGFQIYVKYFNRNTFNSGLLIYKILKQ
jgi:bacillopeptidase F (M6 metalloprotease family)